MINPWILLGVGAVILAVGIGAERVGYQRGTNEQKVAQQERIDQLNADLVLQEAAADRDLEVANAENMRLGLERDRLKNKLGAKHEEALVVANAERTRLAIERLRFGTREAASSGAGCDGSGTPPGDSPTPTRTTVVQLPDEITRDLRSFAYDADKLKADYQLCRDYAQQVK